MSRRIFIKLDSIYNFSQNPYIEKRFIKDMEFFKELKNNFIAKYIKQDTPKPLGRWGLNDNSELKADYANLDSCGDILCGQPDHFKKQLPIIVKPSRRANPPVE